VGGRGRRGDNPRGRYCYGLDPVEDRATRWQQERRLAYVGLLTRFEAYVWAAADTSVQIGKYGGSAVGTDEEQWGISAVDSLDTPWAAFSEAYAEVILTASTPVRILAETIHDLFRQAG